MCGIAGYVGLKNAPSILFDMLKRLEYRGYDSAGIAFITKDGISIPKDKGKVDDVRAKVMPKKLKSNIGVAHTRWATHGVPSKINSHPHSDCTGDFAVAHNGIIENYIELKNELIKNGHKFKSQTDTEVVAHLIEDYYKGDFLKAFRKAIQRIDGSYALTAVSRMDPDKILVARKHSPLLIGLGVDENYIASDAPAFMNNTKKTIILEDGEYGIVSSSNIEIWDLATNKKKKKKIEKIDWNLTEAEKAGYRHFMLKEIHEEPAAALNAMNFPESELKKIADKLSGKKRVYIIACGTAYHACLTAKYLLEEYGVPSEAVFASEFRYSTVKVIGKDCAVIAVSQSGETADTLAAVKKAHKKGAYVVSVVNVVGSSLTRCSDAVIYTYSGPEIAVASTKAYIGQLVVLTRLCLAHAINKKKITQSRYRKSLRELRSLDCMINNIIKDKRIRRISEKSVETRKFFFIGRNINYPTALEGALKLKEITYLHAEGYAAGELKHGPLAVLDSDTTVIALVGDGKLKVKMESNIQEAKARGANMIKVGPNCDINVPETDHILSPILNIVPLHMLSYYISVLKGLDPDKPRNLAKSVTVE